MALDCRSMIRKAIAAAFCLACAQTATAQTRVLTIQPPPLASFSLQITGSGDVDGDSVPDVVALAVMAGANAGAPVVAWYSGYDGALIRSYVGVAGGDPLDLFRAGDLDGDGVEDVGFLMSTSSTSTLSAVSGAAATLIWSTADVAAQQATRAGDYDNDGTPDVLVTSKGVSVVVATPSTCLSFAGSFPIWVPCTIYSCTTSPGQVLFRSGASGSVLGVSALPSGDPVAVAASAATSLFGSSDASVVIASPGGNTALPGSGSGGQNCPSQQATLRIYSGVAPAAAEVSAPGVPFSWMPVAIAVDSGPDLNGDGAGDVLCVTQDGNLFTGLFSLTRRRSILTASGAQVSFGEDAVPFSLAVNSPLSGASFIGQFNGDGLADYVVVGWYGIEIFSGATGALLGGVGPSSNLVYGPPGVVGDLNGDGAMEFALVTVTPNGATAQAHVYSPKSLSSATIQSIAACPGVSAFSLTADRPVLGAPWNVFVQGPSSAPALLVASTVPTTPFPLTLAGGVVCDVLIDPATLIVLAETQLSPLGWYYYQSFLADTPSVVGNVFTLYAAALVPGGLAVSAGKLGTFGY